MKTKINRSQIMIKKGSGKRIKDKDKSKIIK